MTIYYRKYENYEEYLKHQSSKLNKLLKKRTKSSHKVLPEFFEDTVIKFKKRISPIISYCDNKKIICLGARTGAEVKAFIDLGFKDTIGIDLNPGENNPYVIKGDFNNMPFDDNSFDIAYCNCIDHVFNVDFFSKEVYRILRNNSFLILEVSHLFGNEEKKKYFVTHPKLYESCSYDSLEDLKKSFSNFIFKKSIEINYDKEDKIIAVFRR